MIITFIILLLSYASITDIKIREIPDTVCMLIAVIGIAYVPYNFVGIMSSLPLLIAAITCGGIGGGDIKLMSACGMILGLTKSIIMLILGLISMLIYYVGCCMFSKKERPKSLPLAPFLSIGFIISYFI